MTDWTQLKTPPGAIVFDSKSRDYYIITGIKSIIGKIAYSGKAIFGGGSKSLEVNDIIQVRDLKTVRVEARVVIDIPTAGKDSAADVDRIQVQLNKLIKGHDGASIVITGFNRI